MAIIDQPLSEGQILGFKGIIDFYYFRGKVVAREWPRKRTIPPTAKEAANQSFFGQIQTKIKNMSEPNRQQWREFVRGTNIIWTDAIRFFNLTQNPDHEVLPNIYWRTLLGTFNPLTGNYEVLVSFWKDEPCTGSDFHLLFTVSDQDLGKIVWQSVGQKRRRRAIISDMFRPQFTGFNVASDVIKLETDEQIVYRATIGKKWKFIRFVLAPASNPIPARAQSIFVSKEIPYTVPA